MSGRMTGIDRGGRVRFTFDGREFEARAGETLAMALWASGVRTLRHGSRDGAPRGVLCNMGVCYECLVCIGSLRLRACTTVVEAGMVVEPGGRP